MSTLGVLQPGAVSALGWTLVHFLWQGAAVASLLAVANLLLRRSPRARYGAALAALIAMLALPVATFVAVSDVPPAELRVIAPPPPALAAAPAAPAEVAVAVSLPVPDDPGALLPPLVAFWAAGVVLLSLRTLGGWAIVWRLRRSGRRLVELEEATAALARRMRLWRPVQVCESLLVEVPTAIGWLKPMVLLPPATLLGLSTAQLELVLAHELAHIRRLDPLVAWLQAAAETLLFYHPGVWWVSHRLRVEREECCDDVAVAECGNALDYARVLATLEELRQGAPLAAMALSGGSLASRVRRLVSPPSVSAVWRWPVALLVLLMGGAAVVLPATLRAGPAVADISLGEEMAFAEAVDAAFALPVHTAAEAQEPARREPKPSPPSEERRAEAPAFTTTQILALSRAGVTPEYVEEFEALGHRGLSSDELIELRQSGVTPEYARELAELGYTLSREQLLALRSQGVTPDYVRELAEEGLRDISPGGLMQLRSQGVTADYARELREAGTKPMSALELTMLRNQGVSPEDVAALKAIGHTQLSVSRLTALRSQGVTADYIEELKALGYAQLSVPVLIALRNQGVTPDYVRELQELGYRGLAPATLINLRNQGVTPEWVRELRDAGWTSLSTDELANLRSEGFQPSGWRRQP